MPKLWSREETVMDANSKLQTRCAIYTRKSSARGLEQHVTSMEAQRDVCSAYVKCNAHRGWVELETRYDDGGFTGANLQRPALQLLLQDIDAGRIDAVLFYKIDRLTRSLSDFVRLLEAMKRYEVAFISVTQSFDTSETMGRLVLNILLTFAQFEREMLSDRIRDKLSAMRKRGMFVHGHPPLGYDKVDGRLVINLAEADLVRSIFARVGDYPKTFQLLKALRTEGVRTKAAVSKKGRPLGGTLMHGSSLYQLLRNPLYIGLVRDGDELHPAAHAPIVSRELFDAVQAQLQTRRQQLQPWDPARNILRGLLYDPLGRAMHFDCNGKGARYYRYYGTARRGRKGDDASRNTRVGADNVEQLVHAGLRTFLSDPSQVLIALEGVATSVPAAELNRLCGTAEARVGQMSRSALRQVYVSCIARIEVLLSRVRILLVRSEIQRLLFWDGLGVFVPSPLLTEKRHVHALEVFANLILAPHLLPPIMPNERVQGCPDRRLVRLLGRASSARAAFLCNPDRAYADVAQELGIKPTNLTRLIRLTYLAPDIQAAIHDGSQPADLTVNKLFRSPVPLDWEQQRIILGFRGPIPSEYAEHRRLYC